MKGQRVRLSLEAARLFYAIADYARRYGHLFRRHPERLRDAAADVMDGWKLPSDPEVRELIRKGLLLRVRVEPAWPGATRSTWDLTDEGCALIRGRRTGSRTCRLLEEFK